ncbi:MAG: FtsX-like permease family protein [Rhodospirillaceae bacterium]|nr:FtsX-like permease family protein [Rhodospirillaceae bacterium]
MTDTTNNSTTQLAWRVARREMRTGLKGFWVFLACITLGVAAIAAVGSLNASVKAGLETDARRLLGGDADFRTQHLEASDDAINYLKNNSAKISKTVEMKAMAQTMADQANPNSIRALVELKAVDGAYPLISALKFSPPSADAQGIHKLLERRGDIFGAAADSSLLLKLGLTVGDNLRIGNATFNVRAIIEHEPDRVATVVNFGPRLMVSINALDETGLVQPGSQIHYHTRVLLKPNADGKKFIETVEQKFPDAGWRIRGLDKAAPGLERFTDRFALFLGFASMTALLVGGFGVFGAVESYLETKLETIATLKCLGAPGGLVFRAYLLQVFTLGLLGIGAGLTLGALLPLAGIELVKDYLPMAPRAGIYFFPLFQALVFGILVSLTFALWPLAVARETPAANLFRTMVVAQHERPKNIYIIFFIAGLALIGGLVILWSVEKNFAYWFLGVSALTIMALRVGGRGVVKLAKKLPRAKNAIVRLVISNLHRPGNSTVRVVSALGVGLSVLVGVALIQGNLASQINEQIPERAPAFFFIDIQSDQVEKFDNVLSNINDTSDLRRMPSMRGRIVKINGVPVEQAEIASNVQWAVRGDRALTYSAKQAEGTEIVKGQWWDENYSGPPIISFDAGVARGFGVDVGDSLTLNVLGREITAEIKSLRKIDWRTLRFDFAIIFAPGTLEGAPHTHIAAISAPLNVENAIEQSMADNFPNISTIRVRDALEAANNMLAGISTAIQGTASVTILAGIIVLAGTIAAGHSKRVYDSVVFKVLGATRRQVLGAFVAEYALLGFLTGIIALLVGAFISWAVITQLMDMAWAFQPMVALLTVGAGVVFTTLSGLIGTWSALGEKAAIHLRNE